MTSSEMGMLRELLAKATHWSFGGGYICEPVERSWTDFGCCNQPTKWGECCNNPVPVERVEVEGCPIAQGDNTTIDIIGKVFDALPALLSRIETLEGALKPFAEAAEMFDPSPETFEVEGVGQFRVNDYWTDQTMLRGFYAEGEAEEYTDDWLCSVGDLRKARSALTAANTKGE